MAKNLPSYFYIFKSPTITTPILKITRRSLNVVHRKIYHDFIEQNYTYDKFLNGAIQATLLSAIHIRERRLDRFREISTERCTNYIRRRIPELPDKLLEERLNFNRQQILNGFIHSSFFKTSGSILNPLESDKMSGQSFGSKFSFHSTFVFFIDLQAKESVMTDAAATLISDENDGEEHQSEEDESVFSLSAPTIAKLCRRPENLLVCNLSIARSLAKNSRGEYGRWLITDINFFDCAFSNDDLTMY